MSSIINLDRDLQYMSPGTATPVAVGPSGSPIQIATRGFQVESTHSVHNHLDTPVSIPVNNYACAGVCTINRNVTSKRVFRARGTIAASTDSIVALCIGYSSDPIGTTMSSNAHQYVVSSVDGYLNFDETIAVDPPDVANPPRPETDNILIFVMTYNGTQAQTDHSVLYSLSVQDMAVAPPEYESARR